MTQKSTNKHHPEALANMLMRIIQKTPTGGATIEDIEEAYAEIKDSIPARKTIYRNITRLEQFLDPLASGETPEEGETAEEGHAYDEEEGLPGPQMEIKRIKRGKKTYYLLQGEVGAPAVDFREALLTALSLYPQHRSMLQDVFQKVMQRLMTDVLTGVSMYTKLISDINNFVHVAEPQPINPLHFADMINEIFRAISERKKLKIKYLRTYDGELTDRVIDPYGLINRFNNWYLSGYCHESKGYRVFHLVHIRDLEVLENKQYQMPPNFSLEEFYSQSWALWTTDEPGKAETVRLWVNMGAAERFRNIKFHPSQKVNECSGGGVEVMFRLKGASEIIPWLAGWGTEIKVLEPEWLREKTIEHLQNTIAYYRES